MTSSAVRRPLLAAVLVTALVGSGCGVDDPEPAASNRSSPAATGSSAATSEPTSAAAAYPDWLAPSSEITVGTHRAVSPCQVLGPDDVAAIYAPPAADDQVTESYLDASFVPGPLTPSVTTSCEYGPVVAVELEAEQYADAADQTFDFAGDVVLEEPTVLAELASFEAAVADPSAGADAETTAFVTALRAGVSEAQSQIAAIKGNGAVPDPVIDGQVLPVADGFAFTVWVGTVAYRLTYTTGLDDAALAALPAGQLVDLLARTARAVALVRERAADPTLSQSPVRTILGTSDQVGETQALEACAVLTAPLVQRLTGLPLEPVVRRTTLPVDLSERVSAKTGNVIVPGQSCERDAALSRGDQEGSRDVSLDIETATDSQRLRELLRVAGYLERRPGTQRLDTDADFAHQGAPVRVGDSTSRVYVFTVGAYFCTISIRDVLSAGLTSDIDQVDATQSQYVAAINAVVASLEQHRAAAEAG